MLTRKNRNLFSEMSSWKHILFRAHFYQRKEEEESWFVVVSGEVKQSWGQKTDRQAKRNKERVHLTFFPFSCL